MKNPVYSGICSKNKYKYVFYLLLLIIYFIFHTYIITNHEAFRDEAQAWTIARNTSVKELFADLCIEGHPCLWFLVIRPFAKLGLSYRSFSYFSLAVMTVCAALFLFKSPFNSFTKTIVLFSSLFCYNNPVVPRIYCIIFLLVMLLALLWQERTQFGILYCSLIALLFQSHIIMAGFAGGVLLEFIYSSCILKKRSIKQTAIPVSIPCISMVLTFFELRQRADVPKFVNTTSSALLEKLNFSYSHIISGINALEKAIWGDAVCEIQLGPVTGKALILLVLLIIAVYISILALKERGFSAFFSQIIICVCGLGFALAVRIFVYEGGYHMTTCYFLILLFIIWTVYCDFSGISLRRTSSALMCFVLLLTYGRVYSCITTDINGLYSGSRPVADFIRFNIPENSVIIANEHHMTPSVYAYTASDREDILFWSYDRQAPYKIHVWGELFPEASVDDIPVNCEKLFPASEVYYLVCEKPLDTDFELIYSVDSPTPFDESFWLYKIQ